MKTRGTADRMQSLADRIADDIQASNIIRQGVRELRKAIAENETWAEKFHAVVELATSKGLLLEEYRNRQDKLRDIVLVARLELNDAVTVDPKALVDDMLAVLDPEGLETLLDREEVAVH